MMQRIGLFVVAALVGAVVLTVSPAAHSWAQGGSGPLPPGPGVELVYAKCTQCHPITQVAESKGLPVFLWEDTVALMKKLGMKVTEQEESTLLGYLTVYMGPNPPPADTASEAPAGGGESASGGTRAQASGDLASVDGAAVYQANCAACHQPEGQGMTGTFPPLAGHAAKLFAADRDLLPLVLRNGLQTTIEVEGTSYSGFMPAWPTLSDAEVAAVLNHVLSSWGNQEALPEGAQLYTVEDVTRLSGVEVDVVQRRQQLTLD